MKLLFEADVTFMNVPALEYTKENCDKCCLDTRHCRAVINNDVCSYGKKGYFVYDKLRGRFTDRDT
jgi:hypothetical protein